MFLNIFTFTFLSLLIYNQKTFLYCTPRGGKKILKDYTQGALEALAWVQKMLNDELPIEQIKREIRKAKEDILAGVAVDFKRKLNVIT